MDKMSDLVDLQSEVWKWCQDTFDGIAAWNTDRERAYRFFEEAAELFQAMGMTAADAHKVVDFVFGRPKGAMYQEIGGVMITLLALASQQNEDVAACLLEEQQRINRPEIKEKIRLKQIAKNQALI